jgi:hypothetical protein
VSLTFDFGDLAASCRKRRAGAQGTPPASTYSKCACVCVCVCKERVKHSRISLLPDAVSQNTGV